MAGNPNMLMDGDTAFVRVDTRRPSQELEAGVCADAVNKRFEDGRAWPRHGVNAQPWGRAGVNLAAGKSWVSNNPDYVAVTGFLVGETYLYTPGNEANMTDAQTPSPDIGPVGNVIPAGRFVATVGTYYLWSGTGLTTVTASLVKTTTPRGFCRFSDPNGFDNLVLVTDDWRTGGGEDGGRGRAWRIVAGQGPQAIPLNGHDVWGESRLVACYNGLALGRQGNERHYFQAAAVNFTTSRIQLNCLPGWANGDLVLYVPDASVSSSITGTSPPNAVTLYYVKNISGNKVELYTDAGLTTKLDLTGGAAIGRFYLERQASNPGFFGNGAPALLMQPDGAGKTAFEAGFLAAPTKISVSAVDGTGKVYTVPNHRLIPGDKVVYTHSTGATESFFVSPQNNDTLTFYTSVDLALAAGAANAQVVSPTWNAADYVTKYGASGLPMPPWREGCYYKQRVVVVNGRNNLSISDPLDPLHFTPYAATLTANLGESDEVRSVIPQGDTLIIGKANSILALDGLSGPASGWVLREISRQYGIEAPLATLMAGADTWGFGRKGVLSVYQTEFGVLRGQARPKSRDVQKYIDLVDWRDGYAKGAAAATWNNRYFIALPFKGQDRGAVKNNGVLVYNFLNQDSSSGEDKEAWEGLWQGGSASSPLLGVYCFAKHIVYGEERLCFVNYDGQVCWLGDGWTDAGNVAIADKLVTRTYGKGDQGSKLFLKGRVVWDTNNPSLSVTARAPGYQEEQVLLQDKVYDPTKYLVYGQADYDPATADAAAFNRPHREDYSLSAGEVTIGEADVHQNVPEDLRMRINDWGVQLVIENKQGSARVQSAQVEWVAVGSQASRSS